MGKKGTKRKTRWRVLPIGEDGGGSCAEDETTGNEVECHQLGGSTGTTYARAAQLRHNTALRRPRQQQQRYQEHNGYNQPLVTTEKQIFNEEEYTKITTPRQDVLFKKGYLGRKKPVLTTEQDTVLTNGTADANTLQNDEANDNEGSNEMLDEQPQFIYTNGFVDQNSGIYYINGSGYEMYDPYTGSITVIVGPHYGPNGGPPVLAAVPCQPVPLQPLEWFNPPGFLPYVTAPCHNGLPRDRRKRYSTDSQNCSPQSSESTGPPGSPQESDEVALTVDPTTTFPHHQPPAYIYPGYMFGAPMYNVNGVTVQSTPNQAPSSDVQGKRRKKKRRRRRKRNGIEDGSEESSSEDKDHEEPLSVTSQESSLESDSKHSHCSLSGLPSNGSNIVSFNHNIILSEPIVNKETSSVVDKKTYPIDHKEVSQIVHRETPPIVHKEVSQIVHKETPPIVHKETPPIIHKETPPIIHKETPTIVHKEVSPTTQNHSSSNNQKKNFVNGEVTLVNGYDKPSKDKYTLNSKKSVDIDETVKEDEQYETWDGYVNLKESEEEWITVKAKEKGRKTETNGLTNGHAKIFKREEHHSRFNGTRYNNRPPEKLYKADQCITSNKVEEKCTSTNLKPIESINKKGNAKKRLNANKMNGNEERKMSGSSSSESSKKPEEVPLKPSRKDKKNKSVSPPATPDLETPVKEYKPREEEDVLLASLVTKPNLPKVASLKDLSVKSIPSVSMEDTKPSATFLLEETRAEMISNEESDSSALVSDKEPVDVPLHVPEENPPKAPPRLKKWRGTNKRSITNRELTPGKTSSSSSEENSSSSSSQSSEESVIECLSSGLNSPDAKNIAGLSSDDEEIIYTGKLGVKDPIIVGKLLLPEAKGTIQEQGTDTVPLSITPQLTKQVLEEPSTIFEKDSLSVEQMAVEIVEAVIEDAIKDAAIRLETNQTRVLSPNLGITDAVTRWLRTQSPDILTIPEEVSSGSEDEGTVEDVTGSKNLFRNPLPVPSVRDSNNDLSEEDRDSTCNRVANKDTDLKDEDELSIECGEWDDHVLCPTPEYILKYDPLANDTFSPIEGTLLDPVGSVRCMDMCDPNLSVAKYYVLGAPLDKSSHVTEMELNSMDDPPKNVCIGSYPLASLAAELASLTEPLPKSWAVTPLQVGCKCKCNCIKEQVVDSGVESGDDGREEIKRRNVFKRKLVGRLKGEGTPFPCGGVCCIVQ